MKTQLNASFTNTSGGKLTIQKFSLIGGPGTTVCEVDNGASGVLDTQLLVGEELRITGAGGNPFSIAVSGSTAAGTLNVTQVHGDGSPDSLAASLDITPANPSSFSVTLTKKNDRIRLSAS